MKECGTLSISSKIKKMFMLTANYAFPSTAQPFLSPVENQVML